MYSLNNLKRNNMRKHWIGIIKWNDGTILKTEPFYDYDEGIKAWSSKFSYENKGKFEWIDYEKIEEPKQQKLEEAIELAWSSYEHEEGNLYSTTFKNGFKLGSIWEKDQNNNKYTEEDFLKFSEWVSHNDWVYLPSKACWVNEEQEELEQKLTTKELFEKFKKK